MRRLIGIAGLVALACAGATVVAPAIAAATAKAVPGATYQGKGTQLVVDAAGTTVKVLKLPVAAKCSGKAPANEGDYGSSGLGPFTVAANGSFTNVAKGSKPGSDQTVIKGRFAGTKVAGTVVEPAFKDKGFDCARFSGSWSATRVKGTGDDTKPGGTYAKDDFSKADSGFETFNETAAYAEYLPDGRFRIGLRKGAAVASLRAKPITATADISVTTGFTTGSARDGAGLACMGSGLTDHIAGYVSLDGNARLLRFSGGDVAESAPVAALPAGLLKTGDQAQNVVRLVCTPGSTSAGTNVVLYLNGTEVASAEASVGGAGQVGLFVASESGASEFTFSKFSVKKPASSKK